MLPWASDSTARHPGHPGHRPPACRGSWRPVHHNMSRSSLAKIRTYRELPKTLGVGCNKWRRHELWLVNWCWLWTPNTRFHISQHFFSQESQEWNACTQMPKIDYLNSRPTTINLSKPCLMCFSCFSDGSRYKSLVARKMNPKTRSPWSVFPLWTDAFFATEL